MAGLVLHMGVVPTADLVWPAVPSGAQVTWEGSAAADLWFPS